jgi:hypothetical protein
MRFVYDQFQALQGGAVMNQIQRLNVPFSRRAQGSLISSSTVTAPLLCSRRVYSDPYSILFACHRSKVNLNLKADSILMADQSSNDSTLDWRKCADLHNQILKRGWEPFEDYYEETAEDEDRADGEDEVNREMKRSWWDHYSGSSSQGESTAFLLPDILTQLQRTKSL